MNEQSIPQKIATPSGFWRSVHPWVRWAIVIVGLMAGASMLASFWMPALPIVLFFFVAGTGTAALIVKIIVVILFLASIFIVLIFAPLLLLLIAYGFSNIMVRLSESESFADFIFKK